MPAVAVQREPVTHDRPRPALFTQYPQGKVERAYRKAYWLSQWRAACEAGPGLTEADHAQRIIAAAKRMEAGDFGISLRTLQLWERAYSARGADGRPRGVEGLIDKRGNEPKGGGAHEARSQEAIDYFYGVFHAGSRQSIKASHKATLHRAKAHGWTWPQSYAATTKWLARYDDLAESCIHREGRKAYTQQFMPFMERDYSALQPGEIFVTDHTKADFWAREGDVQMRPWLTAMIDARTRRIVGWHLGRTPHQDAILATMRKAFRDCAVPSQVYMDHGADFLSALLTGYTKRETARLRAAHGPDWQELVAQQQKVYWHGVLAELGIETVAAIQSSPWSKGIIERWFGTFNDQCSKTFATYCGHDAASKPNGLEEVRAVAGDVPTLDEARTRIGEWIELYNQTEHTGQGMDGATPMTAWMRAERLRRADDAALVSLLQTRGVYRVGKNGVSFKVGSATLTYGGSSVALRAVVGRDVLITLDPADCSCCYAYTAEREGRRMIGRLEANQRIPANTPADELREAMRKVRGRRKVMGQQEREAPHRLRTAAEEVRAMQAAQRRELRATGTDDHRPNVVAVRTGFEGTSKPVRGPVVDRKERDLADVARALEFGRPRGPVEPDAPRLTLADLAGASRKDADAVEGMDAGSTGRDAFAVLGRDRHERAATT